MSWPERPPRYEIGPQNRQWLVAALGYQIEIELEPLMAFLRYDDVPGVIGRVGTIFGEAEVNIANMAVSRTNRGGEALMALTLDTPVPPEVAQSFAGRGVLEARFVSLG